MRNRYPPGTMTMSMFDNTRVEEVVTAVLQIAPAFTEQWNKHLAYWGNEPRGQYIDTGEIATFLVRCFREGDTDNFPAIFAKIEEWLKREDSGLVELVTVGLLEDIQLISSHESFGMEAFEQWLAPVSKSRWMQIRQMWEGKSSLMDVIRAEKRAQKGGGCA
jgi:hypothetical protein